MKINLLQTYLTKEEELSKIDRELTLLEEKLATPERTVEDIIRHIQLIKERSELI